MAKVNSYQELVADAAERIDQARAMGQQLALLPDEGAAGEVKADRAKRGEGKAQSQLRKWAAARGFRMPEDVLAEMAGMATSDDVFTWAMAQAERMLAWAEAGDTGGRKASLVARVEAFRMFYTAALRAAEAVLPYGLAKVTPDQGNTVVNNIIMPAQASAPMPADRADQARDITPQPRRMAPPPMPHEIQGNQGVSQGAIAPDAAPVRTEGPSR